MTDEEPDIESTDLQSREAPPEWEAKPLAQELALGNVLKLRKAAEGSWSALAHAITDSVPQKERCFSMKLM